MAEITGVPFYELSCEAQEAAISEFLTDAKTFEFDECSLSRSEVRVLLMREDHTYSMDGLVNGGMY